tara:strand:- start:283 stop:672 length:390 start_codon:yes stop_codon:yes gene_type:complete
MITDEGKSVIAQFLVDYFTRANVGSGGNNTSPSQSDLDVPLLSGSGSSLGNTASGVKSDENVVDFKIDILGSNASIEGRTLREIAIFSGAASTTPNIPVNTMLLRIPFDAIGPFSSSEEVEFFIAIEVE